MDRQDGQFSQSNVRGPVGVDGEPIAEAQDEGEVEKGKALESLVRNRTYLGREFLTWLLYKTDEGGTMTTLEEEPVTVLVVGNIHLKGLAGETTELAARGQLSAYSDVVKNALNSGLLVHTARLRIKHGEQMFEVTLDAEHMSFKGGQIPKVLSEEEDDKITERLWLCERLGALIHALWGRFLSARGEPKVWNAEVKAIKEWLASESAAA